MNLEHLSCSQLCNQIISDSFNRSEVSSVTKDEGVAKLVAEYVLAADFDHAPSSAAVNLNEGMQQGDNVQDAAETAITRISHDRYDEGESWESGGHDRVSLWPPQPTSLITRSSDTGLLVLSFIAFLILLSTLQQTMFCMMRPSVLSSGSQPQNPSLLGGVTQALGRRRKK